MKKNSKDKSMSSQISVEIKDKKLNELEQKVKVLAFVVILYLNVRTKRHKKSF